MRNPGWLLILLFLIPVIPSCGISKASDEPVGIENLEEYLRGYRRFDRSSSDPNVMALEELSSDPDFMGRVLELLEASFSVFSDNPIRT